MIDIDERLRFFKTLLLMHLWVDILGGPLKKGSIKWFADRYRRSTYEEFDARYSMLKVSEDDGGIPMAGVKELLRKIRKKNE